MQDLKLQHRLRGRALSEHRRVLAPRHRHVHDPRRRLHARLRLLRRRARAADGARHRGAGARGRSASSGWACSTPSSRPSTATIWPTAAPSIFADTIRQTRERVPGCRIEVLIPDFQGIESSLRTVLDAGPDVLNHNIETVPRLYRMARSGGKLSALARAARPLAARTGPTSPRRPASWSASARSTTKWSPVFDDLRRVGVSILTIGQYLRPSAKHAPMTRYYHPDEFAALKRIALGEGIRARRIRSAGALVVSRARAGRRVPRQHDAAEFVSGCGQIFRRSVDADLQLRHDTVDAVALRITQSAFVRSDS